MFKKKQRDKNSNSKKGKGLSDRTLYTLIGGGLILVMLALAANIILRPETAGMTGVVAQIISAVGIMAAAIFSLLAVRQMRKQGEEARVQWEEARVNAIKPIFTYERASFERRPIRLVIQLNNAGNGSAVGVRAFLLDAKWDVAIKNWREGMWPGGSVVTFPDFPDRFVIGVGGKYSNATDAPSVEAKRAPFQFSHNV